MPTRRTLTIAGKFENLEKVSQFVRRAASDSGLTTGQVDDVEMAVDEAVTNVIEHAYAGQKDGKIIITCSGTQRELVIRIQDYGKPFDPGTARIARVYGPLSRRAVGGLGLFFMSSLMDRVEFSTQPGKGNLVVMAKKVAGANHAG